MKSIELELTSRLPENVLPTFEPPTQYDNMMSLNPFDEAAVQYVTSKKSLKKVSVTPADGMALISTGHSGGGSGMAYGGIVLTANSADDFIVTVNGVELKMKNPKKCNKHESENGIDITKKTFCCKNCAETVNNPHYFEVKSLNTKLPSFSGVDD